jgi:hypothetical protein
MRERLYAGFVSSVRWGSLDGGEAIVALDGAGGYRFVVENAYLLPPGEDTWLHSSLLEDLIDQIGEDPARELTQSLVAEHPAVALYLEQVWDDIAATREDQKRIRQRGPLPDYDQMRSLLQSPDGKIWGIGRAAIMALSDEDVVRTAQNLLSETDPTCIAKYLRFFRHRPFPLPPAPLIEIARGSDEELARRAIVALAEVEHPEIRRFADELIEHLKQPESGARLLVRNGGPDALPILEQLVANADSDDSVHDLGFSVRSYLDANPSLPGYAFLARLYEELPCANCRFGCVEMLLKAGRLPDTIRRECRYDCNERIRELVVQAD